MTPKDDYLHIRIDAELKAQAQKLAKAEGRTLSNWVVWLIQKELNQQK